jgi:hypothetical protein
MTKSGATIQLVSRHRVNAACAPAVAGPEPCFPTGIGAACAPFATVQAACTPMATAQAGCTPEALGPRDARPRLAGAACTPMMLVN